MFYNYLDSGLLSTVIRHERKVTCCFTIQLEKYSAWYSKIFIFISDSDYFMQASLDHNNCKDSLVQKAIFNNITLKWDWCDSMLYICYPFKSTLGIWSVKELTDIIRFWYGKLESLKLTIGSYVSVRSSRYKARGKFGEHERCVRVARGVAESNSNFLSVSKLPKCFISRWTHSWRMNQLFYNIFNPMENFFLEGFVCWRHERAQ